MLDIIALASVILNWHSRLTYRMSSYAGVLYVCVTYRINEHFMRHDIDTIRVS